MQVPNVPRDAWRTRRTPLLPGLFLGLWVSLPAASAQVEGPPPTSGTVVVQKGDPVAIDMPAPPRAVLGEISKHALPPIPVGTGDLPRPDSPPSTTEAVLPAVGAFAWFVDRASKPAGASSSTTTEPTVAQNRDTVLQTGNWYAALSKDNGLSWSHISPYTNFPAADGGFCCDQKAIYVASHDITVWLLQYNYSGTSLAGRHRLAFSSGRANLRNNAGWIWYDITPQFLGVGNGFWLDFPDMSVSSTHIWFSTNMYTAAGAYNTSFLYRADLADFANGGSTNFQWYTRAAISGHSYRFSQGPQPLMYAAAHINTTTLRIYWWGAAGNIAWRDQTVPAWSSATMVAPNPDGRDWAGFAVANDRVLGGYASAAEFGFLWASATVAGRPQPFTRIARFRVSDNGLINTDDVWSTSEVFIYPAACTNALGNIGVTFANGSAGAFPRTCAGIVDGYEPNFSGKSWNVAANGTSGPAGNRWGDYFAVQRHPVNTSTFIATGKEQSGGAADTNARPRHLWFGRDDYTPVWVQLSVTSTPVSGVSIVVDETDRAGLKNGVTPFTRSFAPEQGYTLRAPVTFLSGGTSYRFHQWVLNSVPQAVDQAVLSDINIQSGADTAQAVYLAGRTLSIGSTNPVAGVSISVGLNDVNGNGNGVTAFTRIYKDAAVVPLTAPAASGADPFRRWRLNGINQTLGLLTVNATMSGNVSAIADYNIHANGSFLAFGTGCAGANGVDVQSSGGTPETGKVASYTLAGGRPASSAILVIGFSKTFWGAIPLPLLLAPSAPGCTLYLDLITTASAATNGVGATTINVPIPNDVNLITAHFYTQYLCVDLFANPINLTFSNAIDTQIGGDV